MGMREEEDEDVTEVEIDALVTETFKKIDAFLADPSTGVIREIPERRRRSHEG